MKLIVVRHGCYEGGYLTNEGEQQLVLTSSKIRDHIGQEPFVIYSSNYSYGKTSGEVISSCLNVSAHMKRELGLPIQNGFVVFLQELLLQHPDEWIILVTHSPQISIIIKNKLAYGKVAVCYDLTTKNCTIL